MKPFYEELKKLREDQNIDLSEIQNRTKINLKYLQAIEEGEFRLLPRTYIRLFLRAYVTEIGGDARDALNQLDHYLSRQEGVPLPPVTETPAAEPVDEEMSAAPGTPVTSRKHLSDYIKGAVLIGAAFFAIYIIKLISSEQSEAVKGPVTIRLEENIDPITNEKLIFDYNQQEIANESFTTTAPFTIKVGSEKNLWYRMIIDNTDTLSGVLPHGKSLMNTYRQRIQLRLNHTTGVTVSVNGNIIRNVSNHAFPVEMTFETNPNQVNIIKYSPVQ